MNIQQLTLLELDAAARSQTIGRSQAIGRRAELNVRDLCRWASMKVKWLAGKSQTDRNSELFLYTQAAKLVEEVGELHAALLSRSRLQRIEKATKFDRETLGDELADVIICTAILADVVNVDLAEALVRKMAVVDRRVQANFEAAG